MQAQNNLSLEAFLDLKTLYYDKIDFNTIKIAWEFVRLYVKLPYVIHIVGTNGKGSTGRFLASYLHQSNYKTLHYSSPHILKFNERIWIRRFWASREAPRVRIVVCAAAMRIGWQGANRAA